MIKRIAHTVVIIFLATFQFALGAWLGWLTPDLILAVILALSLTGDWLDTIWWVTIGGLLIGLAGGTLTGLPVILYSLVALIVIALRRQYFHRPHLGIAFSVFLIFSSLFFGIVAIITPPIDWRLLVPAGITSLLAVIFYQMSVIIGTRREVIRLG